MVYQDVRIVLDVQNARVRRSAAVLAYYTAGTSEDVELDRFRRGRIAGTGRILQLDEIRHCLSRGVIYARSD